MPGEGFDTADDYKADSDQKEDEPAEGAERKKKRQKRHVEEDTSEEAFDLNALVVDNTELREQMYEQALKNAAINGEEPRGEDRCSIVSGGWDWRAQRRAGDFCFLCKYGEITSQSSSKSDTCRDMMICFEANYGRCSDKEVALLVHAIYMKVQKDVEGNPDWPLASIMYHFVVEAATDAIISAHSKKIKHLLQFEIEQEMCLVSRKDPKKRRLNIDAVKIYLALDRSVQSTIKRS